MMSTMKVRKQKRRERRRERSNEEEERNKKLNMRGQMKGRRSEEEAKGNEKIWTDCNTFITSICSSLYCSNRK
jgi:hypothetical protein